MTMTSDRGRFVRRLVAVGIAISGWAIALLVVRVGLDWSDSQPYAPWVETYYIVLAITAVLLAVVATVTGGLLWHRARLRPE
ncbi:MULTISPECIES: hypothetical protein [unclassified Brevibacterium]|uniref:hypothetical protein n=1 Tax=unclassified Brevibacterium TaxID=2614124 RepID=UPI0010F9514F|nr:MULTISPECIES: hypothetical protein [unclassified Brevibacterium]MCM1014152.1 hypothetical protein [Brevibacterium sp. XM4083]